MRVLATLETASGFTKGTKVEVQYFEDRKWYPATIVKAGKREGLWVVKWDEPGNPNYEADGKHIRLPKGLKEPTIKQGTGRTFTEQQIRDAANKPTSAELTDWTLDGWKEGPQAKNPFEWLTDRWKAFALGAWMRGKGYSFDGKMPVVIKKNDVKVGPMLYIFDESLERHRATTNFMQSRVQQDDNVGRKWTSPDEGVSEVKELVNDKGILKYRVINDVYKHGKFLLQDQLENQIKLDEMNAKSRANNDKADEAKRSEDAKRRSMNGFAATLTPMQRGKAEKTLIDNKGVQVNGTAFATVIDALEHLVAKGYIVEDFGDRTVLMSPNGAYLENKALGGKIGMQYAAYLYNIPFAKWTHRPKGI